MKSDKQRGSAGNGGDRPRGRGVFLGKRKALVAALIVAASSLSVGAEEIDEGRILCFVTNGWKSASNAVVCTAAEAKAMLEGAFAKTGRYASPQRRAVVGRMLDEGNAWLVKFDRIKKIGDRRSGYKDVTVTEWSLVRNVLESSLPPRALKGRPEIYGQYSVLDNFYVDDEGHDDAKDKINCYAAPVDAQEFAEVFGPSELLAEAQGAPTNTESAVVVADVEDVRIFSLQVWGDATGRARLPAAEEDAFHPRAVYRVDMHVRDVRSGACPFRRFAFPVVLDESCVSATGDWLFFRGMTLEVGFSREGGALKVNRVEPALPYPPYSKDGICIYREISDIPQSSPFCDMVESVCEIRKQAWDSEQLSKSFVIVQYGDRELAVFKATTNLVTGLCGIVPDFGPSVKIIVYGDGSSNLDYWRTAWFAEPRNQHDSRGGYYSDVDEETESSAVSVIDIGRSDGVRLGDDWVSDEKMFRFKWRNAVLPTVCIRPPATIADVAAFFNVATCPAGVAEKGEIRYAVSADASAASRVVRPFAATNICAFAALERICAENGCALEVKGTNVLVTAEVEESLLRRPDLDALSRELAADGFVDVSGAVYANVYAHPVDDEGNGIWGAERDAMSGFSSIHAVLRGNGWVVPPKAGSDTAKFLAYGCVWYEAKLEPEEKADEDESEEKKVSAVSYRKERLARDVVFVRAHAEEIAALFVEPSEDELADLLCFALHAHEAGFADEAERIVSALFVRPKNGATAVKGIKKRLALVAGEYPDFKTWTRKAAEREKEEEKRRASEDDEDDKSGQDDEVKEGA